MKKYRSDMPSGKDYSSSGDAGCIKEASEHKVEMLKNGGNKYSSNNPEELKKNETALAKMV